MNSYEREGRALAELIKLGMIVTVTKNMTMAVTSDGEDIFVDRTPKKVLDQVKSELTVDEEVMYK